MYHEKLLMTACGLHGPKREQVLVLPRAPNSLSICSCRDRGWRV